MDALTKSFLGISMQDVAIVGCKNASMGELVKHLSPLGSIEPDEYYI